MDKFEAADLLLRKLDCVRTGLRCSVLEQEGLDKEHSYTVRLGNHPLWVTKNKAEAEELVAALDTVHAPLIVDLEEDVIKRVHETLPITSK